MKERKPRQDSAQFIAHDHKSEIIERIYDVALDPGLLGDLLEVWEGRIGPLRAGPVEQAIPMDDPEIAGHFSRASIFLDRLEVSRDGAGARPELDDIPIVPAFLWDGGAGIAGFNRAAGIAFGLTDGAGMADLPFDPEDIKQLRRTVRQVISGKEEAPGMLSLHLSATGGPVIVRVERSRSEPRLALVLSSELVWPEGFEATVQEAFGLTSTEVEVVHSLSLGHPIRKIAEVRGRSLETVRTQLRSILAKTETHSQSELVRVVLGLMDVATSTAGPVSGKAGPQEVSATPPGQGFSQRHSLRLPDGRHAECIEFGAPEGCPVLYMHGVFGLTRWPREAELAARARGLRVIVPLRAGYGRSDPLIRGVDRDLACALDYAAVLDLLGQSGAAVLAQGGDLRLALHLAQLRPDLVTGILGCAAHLPLRHASQYDPMGKWQRFILANARYAPKALPFLVKAGFSLARRLGPEKFFALINAGSPADLAAFARPDLREALLSGVGGALLERPVAQETFAQECIASQGDWAGLIHACDVPVALLQGDQDPQAPAVTIRELTADFPKLSVTFVPLAGQLLFFNQWRLALDALAGLSVETRARG